MAGAGRTGAAVERPIAAPVEKREEQMKISRSLLLAPVLPLVLLGGATLAIAQQDARASEPPLTARGGEAELEMLTEQVIDSLKNLDAAPQQEQAAQGDLFRKLNSLVEKAVAEGKTSEEVLQLIEEALGRKGGASLQELLGRRHLDLRQILRQLVERAAARAANPGDAYTRALLEEGNSTRVDATAGAGVRTAAVSGATTAGGRIITVQPGDTLGTLARRYYGDAAMWRRIYQANRDRIANPDLLLAGQRIRIP